MQYLLFWLIGWLMLTSVSAQVSVAVQRAKNEYLTSNTAFQTSVEALNVARTQYNQTPTNANMEHLLTSYKAMIAARTRVSWAFMEALRADLKAVPTVPPDTLASMSATIDSCQVSMQSHIEAVNRLGNRDEINKETDAYRPQYETLPQAYYPILVQLKIAKLKLASQELRKMQETLAQVIPQQILIAQVKEERLRGLDDIKQILNEADLGIQAVGDQLQNTPQSQAYYLYDTAKEQLTPQYEKLQRANTLIREVSAGVEL